MSGMPPLSKEGFERLLLVEKIKVRPKALWRLDRELAYNSKKYGRLVVPKDFVTDFASVPRALWIGYALFGGKADEPAALHDFLYTTRMFERAVCDAIFEEAIQSQGYSAVTSSFMYTGVRAGGWYNWRLENVPQFPHVAEELGMKEIYLP